MSQALLQTQGRRKACKAEGTAHTAWRECVLGRVDSAGWKCCHACPSGSPAPIIKWAGAGLQRALNAERSRAAREGSLVKEDMSGVRRRVEWLRAGTLESVSLGSNPSSSTSSLCDLGQITLICKMGVLMVGKYPVGLFK